MHKFFLALLFVPIVTMAQKNKSKTTPKSKSTNEVQLSAKTADGYTITGNITGFKDGTPVSFLNEQTGGLDKKAEFKGGKFEITGKLAQPGFIGMVFGEEQPMVPLFIENSKISMTGSRDSLDKLIITGSITQSLFWYYTNALKPYEKLFTADPDYDTVAINKVVTLSEAFVTKNPNSFVAPLAIVRLYQASENGEKAEKLYNLLSDSVKTSPIAQYAAQQIAESKINPIGSIMPDFQQNDTTGKPVSITAFRGKYVLVDFWASWCRPCRMENPNVLAAYTKYKDKNFTVLGVSLDQQKPAWINAIHTDGLSWTHVSDLKGWGNSVAAMFQVKGIPQNFLIDPQGKIIAKNLRGNVLDRRLEALLH